MTDQQTNFQAALRLSGIEIKETDRYLFRGKSIENTRNHKDGDWCVGDLWQYLSGRAKVFTDEGWVEVDPSTVGQYTGFTCPDKNGVIQKVFEGDIFEFDRSEWGGNDNIHLVSWNSNGEWCFGGGSVKGDMEWRTLIGNIHDNSELLNQPKGTTPTK